MADPAPPSPSEEPSAAPPAADVTDSLITVAGFPSQHGRVPPLLDQRATGQFQGVQWGDFLIGAMLGRGGMGTVYYGRQISLERPVAIKVLPAHVSQDEVFRSRFLREAKAVAAISSPHVVQVIHAGSHLGHEFYVMELVSGSDLAQRLRRGWRPQRDEAVGLILQAARGLAAAARHRIVHRDIKPANMLLGSDGMLKLTDFGLARTGNDHHLTTAGTVMGTATYLSPEQARGLASDQRSDLYALGVVFYELLTGTPPFVADDPQGVIYQHIHDQPPDPRREAAGIDAGCVAVIHRLMAKDPQRRYQNADELIADLERLQRRERPLAAGPQPRLRRRLALAAGAVAGLAAAGLLVWPHPSAPEGAAGSATGAAVVPAPPASGAASQAPPVAPAPAAAEPLAAPAHVVEAPRPPPPGPALPSPPVQPPLAAPVVLPPPAPPRPRMVRQDEYGRFAQATLAGVVYRFRECPTGTFPMGSPEEEEDRSRDETLHLVSLAGFWITDTEVTQAQWSAVMGGNPSRFPGADRPVEQVSRAEAQEFLRKLGETTPGLAPRLPLEAEWEYACRAGSPTPFANGRPLATLGWYVGNSGGETHAVRSFSPNAWGLYDMHGNVAEWTADGYQEYPHVAVVAPQAVLDGRPVIRGGSYKDDPEDCRCARRDYVTRRAAETVGFRFVINALPAAWERP